MATQTSRGERALNALRPVRVLHPMLLALIPLCGLYAQNAGLLTASALVRPAAVLFSVSLALWLVFTLLRGNRFHGGLLASAVIVPLFVLWGVLEDSIRAVIPLLGSMPRGFFYGLTAVAALAVVGFVAFRNSKEPKRLRISLSRTVVAVAAALLIANFVLAPMFGRRAAWMITAYLSAIVVCVWLVWHYKGDLNLATRSMNWFALILLSLYGTVLLINRTEHPDIEPKPIALTALDPSGVLPDIYILALDGYARSDVLRTDFAYNNFQFEESMRQLGFEIAERSTANYPQAELSLASLLNMDYLSELVELEEEREQAGMQHVFALYHRNRVFSFMREQGYDVKVFSPGLESLEPRKEEVERLIPPGTFGEFEMVLVDRTVASRLVQAYYYFRYDNPAYWRYAFRRARILYMFDEMPRLAQQEGNRPRFVYAPMLLPEPPYLFTRDGGRAQPFGPGSLANDTAFRGRESEYREAYLDQVHFVNQRLVETTQKIVESSKRPVVILVLSSRGAQPTLSGRTSAPVERYNILLMARFHEPDEGTTTVFPDDISLVNVFPVTLNRVFGANLPLHPDRTISVSEEHPFLPPGPPPTN